MTDVARGGAIVMLLAMLVAGCATAQPRARDADQDEILGPKIAEDWDEAESRWRKDIASERWSEDDMNLLTDDPPSAPGSYGHVAGSAAHDANDVDRDLDDALDEHADDGASAPPPHGVWGHVKSGANSVGKASFAVLSVAVSLGMMIAPYLLL